MMELVTDYHSGQRRKKVDEPYIHHLLRVRSYALYYYTNSDAVMEPNFFRDQTWVDWVSLGHDLIEDTKCTYEIIADQYGCRVADGIKNLSNVYTKQAFPRMKRKERKEREIARLAELPPLERFIKTCDRMDNLSMRLHEPKHWKKNYQPESEALFEAMFPIHGNMFAELEHVAWKMAV